MTYGMIVKTKVAQKHSAGEEQSSGVGLEQMS